MAEDVEILLSRLGTPKLSGASSIVQIDGRRLLRVSIVRDIEITKREGPIKLKKDILMSETRTQTSFDGIVQNLVTVRLKLEFIHTLQLAGNIQLFLSMSRAA
jgi:hypothetical protein